MFSTGAVASAGNSRREDPESTIQGQHFLDDFKHDPSSIDPHNRYVRRTSAAYALHGHRRALQMRLSRRTLLPLLLLGFIFLVFKAGQSSNGFHTKSLPTWLEKQLGGSSSSAVHEVFEKPADVKIVALVFFGRRIFTDILDCYLRKNLAVNGGFLDEVHFILHTEDMSDVAWLEELVKKDGMETYYKLLNDEQELHGTVWGTFSNVWGRFATDEDALYVKIDDDMVWIADDAIPHVVTALLAHPEAYSIQANIINSRWNHWFHRNTGAILPYLPESESMQRHASGRWRDSELPPYPVSSLPKGNPDDLFIPVDYAPPFQNHRWLPLAHTNENLMRSPFGTGESLPDPKTSKKSHVNWQIAAQEHYSLLHHIEHNTLGVYAWGRADDGLWDPWYQHYGINFGAVLGKTIKKRPFWGSPSDPHFIKGDEEALTQIVPKELGMPVLIDTRAFVAHYAFHLDGQRENLLMTDLLDRYRALANERVCTASNQKKRLDDGPFGSGYDIHQAGMKEGRRQA